MWIFLSKTRSSFSNYAPESDQNALWTKNTSIWKFELENITGTELKNYIEFVCLALQSVRNMDLKNIRKKSLKIYFRDK